jgi:hypothetical protein
MRRSRARQRIALDALTPNAAPLGMTLRPQTQRGHGT